MKLTTALVMAFFLTLGFGTLAMADVTDCPDADYDGICNCQDSDYVPGTECNVDCPDDDGDGICNGEDPDYVPCVDCDPICPDADGDGICNCVDPDYVPAGDGIRHRARTRLLRPDLPGPRF
jgi:hypothetical protein